MFNKKEWWKKYYQENKAKIKVFHKEYYKKNKEEMLSKHKQYRVENAEELKEYFKQYYQKNRKKVLRYSYEYWLKNKEKKLEQQKRYKNLPETRRKDKEYRFKNRKKIYNLQRKSIKKIRKNLIKELGNKCIKCGFSDWRALQIDHINGGGGKEFKEKYNKNHSKYYKAILKDKKDKTGKYQLLCANCNWIKRYENRELYMIKNGKIK